MDQSYTGKRFKACLLTLVAENPLDTRPGVMNSIVRCPEMGHVRIGLSLANISVKPIIGVLPLSDLADVAEAVDRNRSLQIAYAEAKQKQIGRGERQELLRTRCRREIENALSNATNYGGRLTREEEFVIEYPIREKWNAKIEVIEEEGRADFARAEIGMAAVDFDYAKYIDSVEKRVLEASGLTQQQEDALYAPSVDWHQEWNAYLDSWPYGANQMRFLRAMRVRSEDFELQSMATLSRGALRNVGLVSNAFTPQEAAAHIAFANSMAFKRRHFPELAIYSEEFAEREEESEAPSM